MTDDFERFYIDLKETESADSVLTSEQQLDRLLRPGSTYLNLNPFEVLQLPVETELEEAKKKYKKLSLLVHPDKNPDDRERADQAFDIVKKAVGMIENPAEYAKAKDCYKEAEARLAIIMSEKRRKLKREGKEDTTIAEDDEKVFRKSLWVIVSKVFADREKKRKLLEERAEQEKRRAAETALEAAEKRKLAEEFAKNYEESRDERRGAWRDFQVKKAKKLEKGSGLRGNAFKPPKAKLETSQKK